MARVSRGISRIEKIKKKERRRERERRRKGKIKGREEEKKTAEDRVVRSSQQRSL